MASTAAFLHTKDNGGTGTPPVLLMCSSLDPFKHSKTPLEITDLKEGQGESSRSRETAWWRGGFSWYD